MVDVATLAIKVDTTDLARGEAALEGLHEEGVRAERTVDRLNDTARRTGRGVRSAGGAASRAGRQFQNAAFQVGDFATQIASGQRASVALAQQLPQLLGGFGLIGAALGAAVAIGGALAPVLFKAGEEVSDFDDALDRLKSTAEGLQTPLKLLELSAEDLADKYGEAAETIRTLAIRQAALEAEQAARRLRGELSFLDETLREFTRTENSAFRGGTNLKDAIDNVQDAFGLARLEASEFEQLLENLDRASTFDDQTNALSEIDAFLKSANVSLEKVPDELLRAINEAITFQREAALIEETLKRAAAASAEITIPVPSNISELNDAFRSGELLPTDEELGKPSVRSGGGPADTFASDLKRLQKSLQTQREFIDEWYRESQDILADRRAKEILGEEAHRDSLLRVEEEYQGRLRDLQRKEQDARLGSVAGFFGAMAQATASGGDKLVRAAQAFGAVEATINAYRAASQALADPSVPYWGKAAAYAQVLATGLGSVSAIRGADSGATPTPAAPTAPDGGQFLNFTFTGGLTTGEEVGRFIVESLNEAIENGARIKGVRVS